MSDLASVSDADLLASLPVGIRNNNPLNIKGADGQFMTYASPDEGRAAADQNLLAYGTKHGINSIAGVTARWAPEGDGNNDPAAYAAYVAQRTGIAPNQRIDLTDARTRQALLGAMSEFETGQQQRGRDLSGVSDADLLASIQGAQPPAGPRVVGASHNGGVTISLGGAAPASAPRPMPQPRSVAPTANPTIAQDALAGFISPFQKLGHDVMQSYRTSAAQGKPVPLADTAGVVGDVLGLASAPIQAIIKPTARALGNVLPDPTQAPQLSFQNGKPMLSAPRVQTGDEKQAVLEGVLNTALSGARAAAPRAAPVPAPKPMSLAEVQAASDKAWAAVDKSGFRFAQPDVKTVAADVTKTFADEGGKDLYPRSAPLVQRLNNLANDPSGLTVGQVNRLRSQIGTKLMQPGSDEADMGAMLKDKLESLIQTANDPTLAEARDMYTRLMKMREVSARAESASDKMPLNGSVTQSMRTAMRPLADPKSPQRIRNLTPDETAAVKQLGRGTANQSLPVALARLFDPRSLLGTTMNTMAGLMTGGHAPLVTAPVGMLATAASNRGTNKAVQSLLDLISTGGAKPVPAPVYAPIAATPSAPILSPAGLIGGSALATLPDQIRALLESGTPRPKVAQPAR